MLEGILAALPHLVDPLNIALIFLGLTGGIIVGALPGLTATMGVALMVPATFSMDATSGLIMLGAIYAGAIYGGANSACLICTPGTPSSVATTFDGWPLCQKGRADVALNASLISSAIGGIFGTMLLLFLAAPLARVALKFGGPETFWLCIFGLSTIAVMSSGNMVKGLISGAFGLLISTIGIDPNTAFPRFTFGTYELIQGVEVIPAMIGLFSFSQVLVLIGSYKPFLAEYNPTPHVFWVVLRELFAKCKVILLRSSLIGALVGMLPGAGGEIASIIAYNESKRWDKHPEKYGKGVIEGVASSESANNAVIGGALIPMLTLGIPGSAVAAVILGALLAKGIQPGFKIFTASGDLAYTFIMSQFAVNLLMLPVGYMLTKFMTRLLSIRLTFVAIGIVVLSVIGSYAIRNSPLDMGVVLAFGFIGYVCVRIGMDNGAMALGIILGPMIEESLGRCVHLSAATGSLSSVFLQSPLAMVLIALTLLSMATPWILAEKRKRRALAEGMPVPAMFEGQSSAKSDLLSALFTLVVITPFILQSGELEGVSLLFPQMLVCFMAVGALVLFGTAWLKGKASGDRSLGGDKPHMGRVALISVASIAYMALMQPLGFYPASALFLFGTALCLHRGDGGRARDALVSLFFAALFCVLVWGAFSLLLRVPTPAGLLFE
jgi:putative tricarboxylic transport membrane protein